MCNSGAKDNLGQVIDFIWLGIGATVCKCPHPGAAAMNDRAARALGGPAMTTSALNANLQSVITDFNLVDPAGRLCRYVRVVLLMIAEIMIAESALRQDALTLAPACPPEKIRQGTSNAESDLPTCGQCPHGGNRPNSLLRSANCYQPYNASNLGTQLATLHHRRAGQAASRIKRCFVLKFGGSQMVRP